MSTENRKIYKKIKKATEKDKRMAQLEKEIARLETENSKLKRDSAEYESGLAAFSGTSRFATEFSSLSRNVPSDTNKRPLSQKPEDNLANALQSKGNPENGNRKKKLRMRLMKSRKKDNKVWRKKYLFSVDSHFMYEILRIKYPFDIDIFESAISNSRQEARSRDDYLGFGSSNFGIMYQI